jgi:hypothetical protein
VKAAIVMQKADLTYVQALKRLRSAHDSIREALGEELAPTLRKLMSGQSS